MRLHGARATEPREPWVCKYIVFVYSWKSFSIANAQQNTRSDSSVEWMTVNSHPEQSNYFDISSFTWEHSIRPIRRWKWYLAIKFVWWWTVDSLWFFVHFPLNGNKSKSRLSNQNCSRSTIVPYWKKWCVHRSGIFENHAQSMDTLLRALCSLPGSAFHWYNCPGVWYAVSESGNHQSRDLWCTQRLNESRSPHMV